MRNRRPSPDHAEAVARRLALLAAELDATRAVEERRTAHGPGAPHPDVVRAGLTRISGAPVAGPGEPGGPEAAPVDFEDDDHARGGTGAEGAAAPEPRPLPAPGRHAARGRGAAPGVAESLRGLVPRAFAWDAGQASVVLAGLLLAGVVACAWLVLGRGEAQVVPVTPLSGEVSAAPEGEAAREPAAGSVAGTVPSAPEKPAATEIVVDVAGKVRRPGLVVLPAGSRVADALERAGGVRRGADTTGLNLARPLVDGEQVLVGVPGSTAPGPSSASTAGSTASGAASPGTGAPVSINTADAEILDTLPGVGPVTASAIIQWRTEHGGFTALDDLLEVRGIGEATLARLRPLVTL